MKFLAYMRIMNSFFFNLNKCNKLFIFKEKKFDNFFFFNFNKKLVEKNIKFYLFIIKKVFFPCPCQ